MSPLARNLPLMEGTSLLRYAYDHAITTFDTAPAYQTRDYLRTAFTGLTPPPVIIDHSPARTYEDMERDIAESLVELDREEADIFLLYDVRTRDDFSLRRGAWDYLKEAKGMGLVKAIGLSTHTVEGAEVAATLPEADFVQVIFNIAGFGILDGDKRAMEQALRKLKGEGKVVCALKPLGGGMLSRDHALNALRFVFDHPLIDCVCLGMVTRMEIDAACALAQGKDIPKGIHERLKQNPRRLFVLNWCIGCEECLPVCPTQALYSKDGYARVILDRCDWCGKCGPVCPEEALLLTSMEAPFPGDEA